MNLGFSFFLKSIRDLIKDSFLRKIKSKIKVNEYMINLVGDYVASGFAKVLKDWFEDPGKLSSRDISQIVSSLIYSGILGVLNNSLVIG